MEIKNIFDYATKELSQDAFLRWLFENYDCDVEGVRRVCDKVLRTFLGPESNKGKIIKLKTYAQDYKIDITVAIVLETASGKETHIIAIEDKAFSGEHDQLENYNKSLSKIKDGKQYHNFEPGSVGMHKIFYKTDIENKKERNKVIAAGWKPFYIKEIYENIFKEFTRDGKVSHTGSEILDQYIDRIIYLYENLLCVSEEPVKEWERINFRSFLINKIMPYAEKVAAEKEVQLNVNEWSWQGRYISLGLDHNYQIGQYEYPFVIFSMEIVARTFDESQEGELSLTLRVSKQTSANNKAEDMTDKDDKFRSGIKKILVEKKTSSGINAFMARNYKACICVDSNDLSKRLKYTCELAKIEKYLKESIDAFTDICKLSYNEIETKTN